MATILVTGAGGMLGKKLIKMLIYNGHTVHVLTTSPQNNNIAQKVFLWNEPKYTVPQEAWDGVDTLIHLAGANISKRWTNSYKKEIIDSRVHTAKALLESALKYNVHLKQVISVSGTNYYPDPAKTACSEGDNPGTGFLTDVCIKWENAAKELQPITENLSIFRTGIILSKQGGLLPQFMKAKTFGIIPTTGNPNNVLSWIHIDDMVKLIKETVEKNCYTGIYNAVAPQPAKQIDLVKSLAIATRTKAIHPNVPLWFLRIIMGENAALAGTNQNISSKKLLDAGFVFQFPSIESALTNIYSEK